MQKTKCCNFVTDVIVDIKVTRVPLKDKVPYFPKNGKC